MDEERFKRFLALLEAEDKGECIAYALQCLETGSCDIVSLYEDVLGPALNTVKCVDCEQRVSIWREHVWSSIVRAVIECSYPYVIRQREASGVRRKDKKVVIVCPEGEYHEIGARIAADFFCLCGFDAIFVGSSTPGLEWLDVIQVVKPDYVAISITNFYNLVAAKTAVHKLRERYGNSVRVLAGGYAVKSNRQVLESLGADAYIETFQDIRTLAGEGV